MLALESYCGLVSWSKASLLLDSMLATLTSTKITNEECENDDETLNDNIHTDKVATESNATIT